jgi:serine-type D-Ala-D-Ala carboxypeptidase (penicillin-binding protein 5/6)
VMRRKRHWSRAFSRRRFRAARPGFPSARSFRPGARRHGAFWRRSGVTVAVALAVVIAAAAIFAAVQVLRPVPALTVTAAAPPLRVLPGAAPQPAWPVGGEAVVGTTGVGILAAHGGTTPRPIASLAKIMTAYVVLRDHPLRAGQPGPQLTVTAADVAAYRRDEQEGQSVVKVVAGEKLTEWQALAALLIPSGNNIADVLAAWDAGSPAAFAAAMNEQARSLGLHGTHYADPSGAGPATVSTAAGQFRLTVHALQSPVFRQIVAMPQVSLPAVGLAYNINSGLGHLGIDGVKTGSTPEAGGCLVFSATQTVGGSPATVVGAVLGAPATGAQPSELAGVISESENLLRSVAGDLKRVDVVRPGTVLGRMHAAWGAGTAAVAASGVTVTGWPGMPARVTVTTWPLHPGIRRGQPAARATVTVGTSVSHIPLTASQAVPPPSLGWRLTRF